MRILDLVFGKLIVLKGLIKVLIVNKWFFNFYLYILWVLIKGID